MNVGNAIGWQQEGLGLGGLPAADNLRQNVRSFEEAVPPRTVHPRNPHVESDERHAIELKLKYMSQRQLQNARKKRNKKKNCIRYNLQFIYEYVQIVLTHTRTHWQEL